MRGGCEDSVGNSAGRAALVALALLAQIAYLARLLARAGARWRWASIAVELMALGAAVAVCGQCRSAASKLRWLALILILPLPGLCLYLALGRPWVDASVRRRFACVRAGSLAQGEEALRSLEAARPEAAGQSRYLWNAGGWPVYRGTRVEFHPQGALAFEALKRALRGAGRFIFMEYHAVELSRCFREIEEILAERAAAGVEVRLLYDDVGSMAFVGPKLVKRLEARGIRCRVFNPMVPLARPFLNNRDHRKIAVIDGVTGLTGGYNLCDEYFDEKHPFGHWKDTGLLLRGDAVRSLTAMFLQMWRAASPEPGEDEPRESDAPPGSFPSDGWVQPYASSPLDGERVGENVYLNLVKAARRFVWIATPYLIPDDETCQELALAAKRGVDVRVIVPGIPDKRPVYLLTRSYCARLAGEGVRVYEYVPGFLHAKQLLADGESAAVGTVNLDYRSFYQHFENGVLLHNCAAVSEIRRDFEATFSLCREMTPRGAEKRPCREAATRELLRLLAPLM